MLSQLKADVDSVMGRLLTKYLEAKSAASEVEQADLAQRADQVEETWAWMDADITRWINERCKGQSVPGC